MTSTFGVLQTLRERPIPAPRSAAGYRAIPIDFDGAANAEPLETASTFGIAGRNFYAHAQNPPYYRAIPGAIDVLLLRQGVGRRLRGVNERIEDFDLGLFVFDAWRPQSVQAFFYEQWLPAELRKRRPELSEEDIRIETGRYWAPPSSGRDGPSPHSTGGAIDLTLRWRDGEQLWMGSLFDDASAVANTAHQETAPAPGAFNFSDEEARANRRLLYWLMVEAGFASNPTEWWHYSYGDQMWAKLTGQPNALYAGTEPTDVVAE